MHVPSVHTELSTRRVLVTDYAAGRRGDEDLSETERDRAGEIAFRFYFGLAWRDGIAAGDPHPRISILEAGYPPRSPYFGAMRRLRLPAPTLLMRRLEVRVLALLGDLRAGAY